MGTPCQRGQGPGCESWRSRRGLAAPARTLVKMALGPPRAPGTAARPPLPTCLRPLGKQRLPRPGPKWADAGQGPIQACGGLEPAVFKEQADAGGGRGAGAVCTGWGGGLLWLCGLREARRPPRRSCCGEGVTGRRGSGWLLAGVGSLPASHVTRGGDGLSGFAWLPWFFSLSCPWPLLQSSDRLLSSL